MKHSTWKVIYQAHLGNVDKTALAQARAQETDPYYKNVIDLILEKTTVRVAWDTSPFTDQFREGSPRERLDETVFAFVLRIVAIIKEEGYYRSFRKPESFNAIMAWVAVLRRILVCALALLYRVRMSSEVEYRHVEPAVMRLLSGDDASVLRGLLVDLGVKVARQSLYQAETVFEKLNFLHVGQYGSFYWRFLHWMAEAMDAEKEKKKSGGGDQNVYRELWISLIVNGPLCRTLRCAICMAHFRTMVSELKDRISDDGEDHPSLWFEMHNRVHALRREQYGISEPDYSAEEFRLDRAFMRQALAP